MVDLSPRQITILKHLVEEFIETAKPVGSEILEKKFNLGICPATVRNEMAKLTQMGYIKKEHASSGRIPTPMGLKFYVKQLMEPEKLSTADEISIKDKVWEYRNNFDLMMRQATRELARRTKKMGLAATHQGVIYASGAANLLDEPEFFDIDVAKTTLALMDQPEFWLKLIDDVFNAIGQEEFHLIVGSELGEEFLEPCGFVYQDYTVGPYRGIIGIMGPARLSYDEIIPLVNYFAKIISEISG